MSDWTAVQEALGERSADRLRAHLDTLPPGQHENLGAVVYLYWALHRHSPDCRRPAWVELTFPSFREAERALGRLDTSQEALTMELRSFYGPTYDFREGQLEIVQGLLRGECVPLGLLPTGGGKSLTFQFPALLLSKHYRALTIVVSPCRP
ncbi:hypothetical protein [Deinococcus peraridilitoris]|uniref:hypothetical protein n=1 Tax=Deinococcus peraridilitoris TaxID=432329 RepID=UPI00145D095F|nr:hypothetical protein [Deinococcus peraridilitoris]